jgi:hypothetical protein
VPGSISGPPCSLGGCEYGGSGPPRRGESQICDSWRGPPAGPLVRESAPHEETRSCVTIKICSWTPDECRTPRQTDRLAVCRNIVTLALTTKLVRKSRSWGSKNKPGMTVLMKSSSRSTDRWESGIGTARELQDSCSGKSGLESRQSSYLRESRQPVTTEQKRTLLGFVARQRLVTTHSVCRGCKSNARISENAIIACTYYLQVFGKSSYQTRPRYSIFSPETTGYSHNRTDIALHCSDRHT